MSKFYKAEPAQITLNTFTKIGSEWMLIAAAKPDGTVNMMTASWGGLGVYWNKPVAYTFVRPQRFTKEFIDSADGYSLTFFAPEYREKLNFCGTKSGRDFDKVKECGFDVLYDGATPYFAQGDLVFICKHIAAQPLNEASFINPEASPAMYPGKDFHTIYISEITDILIKGA